MSLCFCPARSWWDAISNAMRAQQREAAGTLERSWEGPSRRGLKETKHFRQGTTHENALLFPVKLEDFRKRLLTDLMRTACSGPAHRPRRPIVARLIADSINSAPQGNVGPLDRYAF